MDGILARFRLAELGTTPRTEALAGFTTWLAMAYIVVVNPSILAAAGMDAGAVFTATCLAAGIASIAMGLWANYPLALAPGMGLNAYFAFAVVLGMKIPWQVALGAVFISGILFLIVSLMRWREWLINAIPLSLKLGIAAGIGLFLAVIGLQGMGLVVKHPATMITLGDLKDTKTILACAGFLLIAGLAARGLASGVLIGILATAALGIPFGLTEWKGLVSLPPSIAPTFLAMDLAGAIGLGVLGVVFTFFLVDLLDNAGTLIATTQRAGLMNKDGSVPRLREALTADSGGAMLGAALGTSTVTSYIESAAGIQAGGRSGLTAVVCGVLFLLTLFLAPLAQSIPAFATAPALVFVACLMARALKDLNWDDLTDYLPAVVTAIAMPFSFSIATGIGLGFITHALVKTIAGRAGEVSGAVWLIAAASAVKLALL
jgi:AGZA family xanthine/uracil permease-like MFS transporter